MVVAGPSKVLLRKGINKQLLKEKVKPKRKNKLMLNQQR